MTLLNRCDEGASWVFGELAVFAPGEHIPVIEDAANQPVVNLEQIETPAGRHPLKGVLYWMAVENHLLAIQTPNMSLTTLTDYLNWLVYTPGISKGELRFEALVSVEDDIAPPVTDIIVRTSEPAAEFNAAASTDDVYHAATPTPTARHRTETADKREITSETKVTDILRAAAFGEANIEKLRNIAGSDGEIILELHLKIRRQHKRWNFQKADALSLISDLDDDNITLRGSNGRHVGKLMKLTYDMGRVKTLESLLDPDDAKRVLKEAYMSFCTNGYIEGPQII